MSSRLLPPILRVLALGIAVFAGRPAAAQPAESPATGAGALKKLSLAQLMEIEVVSVSRHAERLSKTPSSVRVVTGEEIRRSGATTLPQALRLASNLHVAQVSPAYWTIGARGFNSPGTTSNKLLVMIDGRSVYSPLFSGTYWDTRDVFLPDVDRIEVVSGPGGATWGANAVNGVINLISKSAADTQGGLVYGGAGFEERALGGFRYGGRLGASGHYRIYAKHTDLDSAIRPDGTDALNRWVFTQGGFRADWDLAAQTRVTLQGDLFTGWVQQAASPRGEYDGGDLLGRVTRTLPGDSRVTLQAYYDSASRGAPTTFGDRIDQVDLDAQHEVPFGGNQQHLLVWGLNYRRSRDSVRNLATQAFIPARFTHQLYSGFGHAEFELIPSRLRATIGAKVEHNNYSGTDVQPNVRLAWHPRATQTLWLAASRAVRTPSRVERDLYIPVTPPFTAAGGPNYGSEVLWSYEAGWRGRIAEKTSASITGYFHDYDRLRTLEQPVPFTFGNGQTARTYGAEVFFRHEPVATFNWSMGYTLLRTDFTLQPWSRDLNLGMLEQADPKHQVHLRAAYDFRPGWELDLALRHVAAVPTFAARTVTFVPAYTELDARIGWEISPALELSLIGRNLLDAAHPETGAIANRREIERSVHARVTWRF